MSTEPKLRDIFSEALQCRTAEELAEYLERACRGDAELRTRIEELLQAHHEAKSFLKEPSASQTSTINASDHDERLGTMIGPYKLLQQIGEGGMGAVYMAEQTQPVQRKVALKIIKPGMDSKQVLARFEAERQALAVMDHPNIAKVFDAGSTDTGRPYFVMELVKGVPITKYCDEHRLTPRQRLELFLPVCHAIQHAHQKGIIHRDIKPSNILVAPYDGKPVVKVIDFGVAKATGQRLTEKTLFTEFGALVGTLEYMSPEQAELNNQDIDTRSDIYGLGVLLYELLTGSTPLTRARLKEAAFTEMLRIIREEEPQKPSTRLSDSKDALPSISAQRQTEPTKLTKLVRGELDWIVMKALEKDRIRRYETANGFAMDVQRYLDDEPVLACPPSVGYRLRKFVRRNKTSLAMASLVLFFLVLLGSVVGWAWRDRAARATEQANHLERAVERAELLQREGKRGEALAALERAHLLAREAEPFLPLANRIESLQQLLEAEGRDEVFVAQFEAIRREVQTEVDVENSLFSQAKGYPKIREALEQYGIAVGVTPPAAVVTHIQKRPTAIQTVVVAALDECMPFVAREDSGARAWLIDVLQKADSDPWRNKVRRAMKQPATLEALIKDIDVRQQPPSFLLLVGNSLPIESPSRLDLDRRVLFAYPGDFWANHRLGSDLHNVGKHAEAIRYYTAALALRPDNPGIYLIRGNALHEAGELDAAIADYRQSIALSPNYAAAHYGLGVLLDRKGQRDAAATKYREAIRLKPDFAEAHVNLGVALESKGQLDAAIAEYREAIQIKKDLPEAHSALGKALVSKGQLDDAIAGLREAIRVNPQSALLHNNLGALQCDELKDYDKAIESFRRAIKLDPKYTDAYGNLGNALQAQKKWPEAIAAYKKALAIKPQGAEGHNGLAWLLATCSDAKFRDPSQAVSLAKKAVELDPKNPGYPNTLGAACYRTGDWKAAIAALEMSMELRKGGDSFDWFFLAMAHWKLGEKDKAREWYDRAVQWMAKNQPKNEELRRFRAEAAELLGVKEKKM